MMEEEEEEEKLNSQNSSEGIKGSEEEEAASMSPSSTEMDLHLSGTRIKPLMVSSNAEGGPSAPSGTFRSVHQTVNEAAETIKTITQKHNHEGLELELNAFKSRRLMKTRSQTAEMSPRS